MVGILTDIAHRGHVAAAVDILANDGAVADADGGIAVGTASDEGGLDELDIGGVVDGVLFCSDIGDGVDDAGVVVVAWGFLTAVAATEDGAEVVEVVIGADGDGGCGSGGFNRLINGFDRFLVARTGVPGSVGGLPSLMFGLPGSVFGLPS